MSSKNLRSYIYSMTGRMEQLPRDPAPKQNHIANHSAMPNPLITEQQKRDLKAAQRASLSRN